MLFMLGKILGTVICVLMVYYAIVLLWIIIDAIVEDLKKP